MPAYRTVAAASLRAILLIARWLHAAELVRAAAPDRGGRVFAALLRLAIRQHRELALLRRRIARIPPACRPRFRPVERKDILEFGAQFGHTARRLAFTFLVTPETIGRWKRAVERGRAALVRPVRPISAFANLAAEVALMIRRAHPHWGTRRIAGTLARLGLDAARSSVQRFLRRTAPRNGPASVELKRRKVPPGIRPKRPHHVWIMDFSTLSLLFGFATVRVGAVLDSFSRKIVAISLFPGEPTARWTCRLLQAGIRNAGTPPGHVITDRGSQFRSKAFRRHLSRRGIRHRFGAVGSPKSIGRLERFWRTLKGEWATSMLCAATLHILSRRVRMWTDWYNRERPHQGVSLRTPHESERRRPPRRRRPVRPGEQFVLERRDMHDQPGMPVYRLRKRAS